MAKYDLPYSPYFLVTSVELFVPDLLLADILDVQSWD